MEMGQIPVSLHFVPDAEITEQQHDLPWSLGGLEGPVTFGERKGNRFTVSYARLNQCYLLGLTKFQVRPPFLSSALGH